MSIVLLKEIQYMQEKPLKQKILIVDDIPANIRVLGEILKDDYDIMVATSGTEAIKIARSKNPPDMILLDIIMPEMDGYEVCDSLNSYFQTQSIPVIFITTKNQDEDETKGLEIGAVDYITKPFSPAIVKARIKTHLELKKLRDQLEEIIKDRTGVMIEMLRKKRK